MGHDVVFKQAAPGSEDGHAAAACIGTRVYDVMWCDVIWCDVTLHDVIKKNMTMYDVKQMIWYYKVKSDVM